MKTLVKRLALAVCAVAVLFASYRILQRRAAEGTQIAILMYHGVEDDPGDDVWTVTTEALHRHLASMKAHGYTSILPGDIARVRRGWGFFPKKPVVITFDDGFRNNMLAAEPVLREYGMKAICYPILGLVGDDDATRSQYRGRDILTWPEIWAMRQRGTFAFGSHSLRHMPQPSIQIMDADEGRHIFREKTGWKVADYSYPNGSHSAELEAKLAERGRYRTAVTCRNQVFTYTHDANLFELPRISVYGGTLRLDAAFSRQPDGVLVAEMTVVRGRIGDVRGVLRERNGGREWTSAETWAARDRRKNCRWTWPDLPADINVGDLELAIVQQDGIFEYACDRDYE